ncbi:SDR family NAD(P)-dependent oxidoreductase, partial [Streptomyces sp. HPF1205]|uniref:SDR family NAD(P)-dependent oxidoreductase n=1 Tax=Streptomyces sp. HPF1205 TaxID=2873262 RepID=UPI001CEDC4E0
QDCLAELSPDTDRAGSDSGAVVPLLLATQRRDRPQVATLTAAVAEAHVHGAVRPDWPAILGGGAAVDLPTYPFQRRHFWLGGPSAPAGTASGDTASDEAFWSAVGDGDAARLASLLDVPPDGPVAELLPALSTWRAQSARRAVADGLRYRAVWWPAEQAADAAPGGTWVVVVPAALTADTRVAALEGALADRGVDVVRTVVDPAAAGRSELAERLTDALGGSPAAGVLSLLALDTAPRADQPVVPYATTATLVLLQALADLAPTGPDGAPARVWLLTQGAVSTGGADRLDAPEQAQVWALGRTAALEHPRLWGGLIDLPADLTGTALRRVTAALAGPEQEDQLAVRPAGTFVRRLVRAAPVRPGSGRWTPHGTVLITDGTWGAGARVARRLAAEGAVHLLLTHEPGPAPAGSESALAELAELNAHVTVAPCDLTDRAAVAALLAKVPAERPLTAVFHTAGEPRTAPLAAAEPAAFAADVAAKAAGAVHLHDLAGDGLEAFVLFSSVAGLWGSVGQGAYSAAGAHLDALAEHRRDLGRTATAVAWGVWSGTAATAAESADPSAEQARRERLRDIGLAETDPGLALDILAGVLGRPDGEAAFAVAAVDWSRFAPAFTATRPSPFLGGVPEVEAALAAAARGADDAEGDGPSATLAQSLAGLTDAERERLLTDLVRGEIAAVLGHSGPEAVPAGRALKDLGLDSLAAVSLRNRLGAATGLRLSATVVFDHPSPAALAAHLRASLDPAPDGTALDEEFDRLQTLLTGLAGDPAAREQAGARLQSLLAGLGAPAPGTGTAKVAARLDEASDEDMFAFIDSELGTL